MTSSSIKPGPESIDLDILFEDPWLIAVNKPPGLVVHPTYRNFTGTLVNGILAHRVLPTTPGVITRLDKDTSGVVLVSLTPQIHMMVQRDMHAGRAKKDYLAVVCGTPTPPAGEIALALKRDPADRRRVIAAADGARCETRYVTLAIQDGYSLVSCELLTGRTHQLRVHLAASGWPIAGDPVYGTPHPGLRRQALHARRLAFPHPITGETVVLEAPVAADLTRAFPWITGS